MLDDSVLASHQPPRARWCPRVVPESCPDGLASLEEIFESAERAIGALPQPFLNTMIQTARDGFVLCTDYAGCGSDVYAASLIQTGLQRIGEQPSIIPLRAIEIDADVILKGTRVDGIYTADPERDPNATRYDRITFNEVFERGLKVMDMTAFTLCNENNLPIVVFDMNKPGNLQRLVEGEPIGTVVEF